MLNKYDNTVKFFYEIVDDEGKNKIIIDNSTVIEFWESLGYRKVINQEGGYILVQIRRNSIVKSVEEFQLRDEIRNYTKHINRNDVWSVYLNKEYVVKKLYEPLETIVMSTSHGDEKNGYLFYSNFILIIAKEEITSLDYENFNGYIWEEQIVKREIKMIEHKDSVFYNFLLKIANDDDNRFRSLISIIGYLLHTYKDPSITKAIILMDQEMNPDDDEANGGTGKSLIGKAIGYVIPDLFINGKSINTKDKFFLSALKPYHKLLFVDDVDRNFDFEGLYSIITGDMPIEKKYKNATVISFKESPKILISTNYVITGSGGTAESRRKVEFEVSNYFKNKLTPIEEFGHRLFEDWDTEQWLKFDNLMIRALQYYLKSGLIQPISINASFNRLIIETNALFVEFIDELLKNSESTQPKLEGENLVFDKQILFSQFKDSNYEISERVTPKMFKKWIDKYCMYYGIRCFHYKSNGKVLVKFIRQQE
ncbi:DUF5906 domain-containing protein [Flavobacterium sp. ZS1P14]|uniref:DUF5906 domain-containing protein n=1 Tax=Flavobacterium sp. ZS1P14 TaxID=3401729 RepID=UPI003AAA9AA1